jgi:NADPH:quinone reductase-like Zn-dependent oxidoreductase
VSGVVVEVGKKVTTLKKGDIVCSSLHGGVSKNGGFAEYVMVSENATIKLPSSQILSKPLVPGQYPGKVIDSFEAAASIPVGIKTVALSFNYNLAIPTTKKQNEDDYLLIWGGATATGLLAIQIAKLIYGINVITTASKRNHDALRELGADEVFGYNDETVIADIKRAGKNRIKYALDCVSTPQTLQSVYDATEGTASVTIDNLLFLNEKSINSKPKRTVKFTNTDGYIVDGRVHFGHKASPEMLQKVRDFWNDSLPIVLEKVKTAPLTVLPPGMESANEGLGLLMQNKVNGRKVVFRSNTDY